MFYQQLITSTSQYRGPMRSNALHQESLLRAVVGSRAIAIIIAIRRAVVG